MGNLSAMATASVTHGQPVWLSTKRVPGKYMAGRSMPIGCPHALGIRPPDVPACMATGTSSSEASAYHG